MFAGGQVWFLRCVGNCFGLRNQQPNAVARTGLTLMELPVPNPVFERWTNSLSLFLCCD